MEAHTLCSLLPTVKHAILIGDPLQLRPETNEQMLTLETRVGMEYRLDESLLERLMLPRDPSVSAMPVSHLNIQRRMHPEIANITRITYPYLKDHESTLDRSPTHRLVHRMFWWDHRIPEVGADDLKSHINLYEVEMVAGLVNYLLRGGAYDQGDIAILTPYCGQLSKLHERLSATCDIWLSEKDRELLLDESLVALGAEGRVTKDEVPMSDMLRITTVDNFQGEEARVIILSSVRSGGTAGFLKTINRINVACSRARDGFYTIGNSQTLSQVPMWRQVMLAFNGRIGASLQTCCSVHHEHHHAVEQPSDFESVPVCSAICGQTLPCGHECPETCHPPQLHSRITCQEKCTKVFPCGHSCSRLCYQDCGTCQLSINGITLACGHPGQTLCSGETSKCEVVVSHRLLDCGHTLDVLCGEDPERKISCANACLKTLPCGHQCPALCGACKLKKSHKACSVKCGEPKACGHPCKEFCHQGKPCSQFCSEPCSETCEHGPCKNRCSDICDPCIKLAKPGCGHQCSSDTLCCLPNTCPPCCLPCPEGRPLCLFFRKYLLTQLQS